MATAILDDLQIPPAKSPLLVPTDRHHRGSRHNSTDRVFRLDEVDPLDDLEFLAPSSGSWEETAPDDASDSDDESLEDFSLHDGTIAGVPSASVRLEAKQYHAPEFAASLLELLRDDLQITQWANLPSDLPPSLLHIHKVSGSLTNAVFFISLPAEEFTLNATALPSDNSTPVLVDQRVLAAAEMERGRATPTPDRVRQQEELRQPAAPDKVRIEAPTLLLRIYGPSSGSLISRKTELHILHTLSSAYGIGPRVLGTFANGRVEEYFHSRALHKEELRDPRISRWIGRRMRELHRVELERMLLPGGPERTASSSSNISQQRPSADQPGSRGGSAGSVYSTSSSSSVFSFGTSAYSTSSAGSSVSLSTTIGEATFGSALTNSPAMIPRRGSSESRAESKRRSRSAMTSRSRRGLKDKLGAWENITRWTREAKLVLKELDQLVALPGFSAFLQPPHPAASTTPPGTSPLPPEDAHVEPLSSPSLTLSLREELNLPLFEQQVKLYRTYVREWEKREGKSKRVFSHNDTQYGNLLLQTPDANDHSGKVVIHCIDFEYSSANPRGFDIANHFIEWQANYHHPTLSHSLSVHGPYPDPSERARFLRAYIGCDGGLDTSSTADAPAVEDPRVFRLEEEVKVWEPSSHAMWAVWGIVQAKEDLLIKVERWKRTCARIQRRADRKDFKAVERLVKEVNGVRLDAGTPIRPVPVRGKSGETVGSDDEDDTPDPAPDFDYLSYALGRMRLFRLELKALGITQ